MSIFAVAPMLVAACTLDRPADPDPAPATSALAPNAHEMQPIATVISPSGTTIKFFPVSYGGYGVLEHGEVGQAAVLTHEDIATRSVADVYRKASGESAVPGVIAALSERVLSVDAMLPSRAVGHLASPSTPIAASGGSCPSDYFKANGGCQAGAMRTWCLLDWWNGAYEYASSTDLSFASICADIGSVLWQIQNGDGGFHQISVLQGQWWNYSFHDAFESWLHYDVLDASGDRFQFGGEMY